MSERELVDLGHTYCVFCQRIDAGEYEASVRPEVVTFIPLNPVVPGHRLFVPRAHIASAVDGKVGPFYASITMEAAGLWARDDVDHTGATGWNFITSAGRHATQTIFHLHVHVIPRRRADGLVLPWTYQVTGDTVEGLVSDQPGGALRGQ